MEKRLAAEYSNPDLAGVAISYDFSLKTLSDSLPIDQFFSAADEVLARYGARPDGKSHRYVASLPDGNKVGLYSISLFEYSLPFHASLEPIGGMGASFCDFVYEFACATESVLYNEGNPQLVVVVHTPMIDQVREVFPPETRIVRVSSANALLKALESNGRPGRVRPIL